MKNTQQVETKSLTIFLLSMAGIVASLIIISACCGAPPAGVDVGEIYRRGDSVEYINGIQSEPNPAIEAMAPPATDADKWFVSVLTAPGCSGCKTLLKEWETNDWLRSIADPNDAKKSWAHFSVYDKSDRSQAFRFKTLKVTTYPTVIVQPPRTGKYGEASTVVYQGVYTGDARKLAEAINSAIRLYVERVSEVQGGHQQAPWQPRDDTSDEDEEADGRLFPLFNPDGSDINIPPLEVQIPSLPWQAIIGLLLAGAWPIALVLLAIWGVKAWRAWRKGRGEKLVFEGDVVDRLLDGLQERFTPKTDESAPAQSATTNRRANSASARRTR